MAIKITAIDGTVIEFDTVEEALEYGEQLNGQENGSDALNLSDLDEGDKVRFKTDYVDSSCDSVSAGSTAVVFYIDGMDEHVSVHVDGKPVGGRSIWVDFADVSTTLEIIEEAAEESGDPYNPFDDEATDELQIDPDKGVQVGDKFVVNKSTARFKESDVVEIVKLDGDGCPKARRLRDGEEWYVRLKSLTPAQDKDVYKVGDKVRITNNLSCGFEEGTVGRIKDLAEVSDGRLNCRIESDTGGSMLHASYEFELVESAEVPERIPKYQVGDRVNVVRNTTNGHSSGTTGKVVRVDVKPDNIVYDIEGDKGAWAGHTMLHVEDDIERINQDHSFKVGDKVRLLDNDYPITVFSEVGAIGTVVEDDVFSDGADFIKVEIETSVYGNTQYVDPTQVELVKPLAQDANGEDLYDGDYVVAVEGNPYNVTDSDMLCRVADKEPDNPGFMEADITVEITEDGFLSHKGESFEVASTYFVKTTPEEFEESKQPEEPELEVGDYAKVKSLDGFMGDFSVGEIVKVVDGEVNDLTGHIEVSKLSREWNGFPNPSDVEKVELTDRDKAFLKAGRDIGEFKHGDIVRLESAIIGMADNEVRQPGIYTVKESKIAGLPLMLDDGERTKGFVEGRESQLSLVCPAEQRLDIGDDADV